MFPKGAFHCAPHNLRVETRTFDVCLQFHASYSAISGVCNE